MNFLPIRFLSTSTINAKISALKKEQDALTRELYRRDLDSVGRASIDVRERELIREIIELTSERSRRGRRLAEGMGFIKSKEEKKP